jgi:cellulose synthase/poly-beta-1,6-N-acetylglucosamine synthase-like glycosyltransferase
MVTRILARRSFSWIPGGTRGKIIISYYFAQHDPEGLVTAGLFLLCGALVLTAVYAGLMGYCILGALILARNGKGSPAAASAEEATPPVSVIVPLRNEEAHALATLQALALQDYAGWWEVICVNDRSTDGTGDILAGQCTRDPRFSVVTIPAGAPPVTSPKKRALAEGFLRAKGAILMTTDADCLPPPCWMRSMASRFTAETGMVQGPKRIRGDGSLLSRYQEHEVFGLVSIEAASFALGRPMVASAPSLAYRKDLYDAVGGFAGLEDTVSGDDDLLMRKMVKVKRWKVAYNPDPEACVSTSPVDTWKGLLQQRARWASNGAHYDEKGFVALLVCIYAFYWWLAVSPWLAWAGLVPWAAFLVPAACKLLLSGIFLSLTSRRLGHRGILKDLWWCEMVHVPIVIIAVIFGHLGLYRWK